MDFRVIEVSQCGESPELEKIKEKVFGRKVRLPSTDIQRLEKFGTENMHTFIMAREELAKYNVEL